MKISASRLFVAVILFMVATCLAVITHKVLRGFFLRLENVEKAIANSSTEIQKLTGKHTYFSADVRQYSDKFDFFSVKTVTGFVGQELSVFFDNFGYFDDFDRFRLIANCDCKFGRMERRSWQGIPQASDIGIHNLKWKLSTPDGKLLKEYQIKLDIKPAPFKLGANNTDRIIKGKDGRDFTVMFIGDSITRQQFYPNLIYKFLQKYVSPDVRTVGRVALKKTDQVYAEKALPGMFTESFNGWTTGNYVNNDFRADPRTNPGSPAKVASWPPFWFGPSLKEGKLSFSRYIEERGGGNVPDVIFIMLGTNDFTGWGYDEPLAKFGSDLSITNLNTLIDNIRSTFPHIQFFIINPPPPSTAKQAFATAYKADVYKNLSPKSFAWAHRFYSKALKEAFSSRADEKIYYIPANVGFDEINGYQQDQTVHPSAHGHEQIAKQIKAAIHAWLLEGAGGLK